MASVNFRTVITSIPCNGCFGALPKGTTALLNPCFNASFSRSWPLGTGRISPDKPTSPNTTRSRGSARSRKLDMTAKLMQDQRWFQKFSLHLQYLQKRLDLQPLPRHVCATQREALLNDCALIPQ